MYAGAKEFVPWTELTTRVPALLEQIQSDLLTSARQRYDACIEKVRGCARTHKHSHAASIAHHSVTLQGA